MKRNQNQTASCIFQSQGAIINIRDAQYNSEWQDIKYGTNFHTDFREKVRRTNDIS